MGGGIDPARILLVGADIDRGGEGDDGNLERVGGCLAVEQIGDHLLGGGLERAKLAAGAHRSGGVEHERQLDIALLLGNGGADADIDVVDIGDIHESGVDRAIHRDGDVLVVEGDVDLADGAELRRRIVRVEELLRLGLQLVLGETGPGADGERGGIGGIAHALAHGQRASIIDSDSNG